MNEETKKHRELGKSFTVYVDFKDGNVIKRTFVDKQMAVFFAKVSKSQGNIVHVFNSQWRKVKF